MIEKIRVKNCFVFNDNDALELNLSANNQIQILKDNVNTDTNILKTVVIYGPNNVGKSKFISVISAIKNILLDKGNDLIPNFFSKSNICELGITFFWENKKYNYELKYNFKLKEYIYEKMENISDRSLIFLKDKEHNKYKSNIIENFKNICGIISNNNILIYTLNDEFSEKFNDIKNILINFASNIEVIDCHNLSVKKTLESLKNHDEKSEKIINFIKSADADLNDFYYADEDEFQRSFKDINGKLEELFNDDNKDKLSSVIDQLHLFSVHKGKAMSSIMIDSIGTRSIVSMASYIVEAILDNKILFIDELDSNLHYRITQGIVALFNNPINKCGQLIFTTHDIALLKSKKLLRKDQIHFFDKDDKGVYNYSLNDFTAEDGIRNETDIFGKYTSGKLGAVPNPNFIDFF